MVDNRKIVEFVQVAEALVKKAGSELERAKSEAAARTRKSAAVKQAAERTADALVAAGLYKAARRDDVVAALCDPERALHYIAKLAAQQTPQEPKAIGRPDAELGKAASASSPFVGGKSVDEKESDRAWRRALSRIPTR